MKKTPLEGSEWYETRSKLLKTDTTDIQSVKYIYASNTPVKVLTVDGSILY